MKRVKIVFVVLALVVIILGFLVIGITQYQKELRSGQTDSLVDFIIGRYRYLSCIPIILGIIGLFKRTIVGWTCIACVFYFMLFMGTMTGIKNDLNSFYELSTYLLFMMLISSPLIILNKKDLKSYYGVESNKVLWTENMVALTSMAILGTGLIVLNG